MENTFLKSSNFLKYCPLPFSYQGMPPIKRVHVTYCSYHSTMGNIDIKFISKGAILFILCLSPTVFGLKCIKGVDKFAASEGLDYFYECSSPGEIPILKQCSSGQIYDRKAEKCQRRNCKFSK